MKDFVFTILMSLLVINLFGQSHFTILGKTNLVFKGEAILVRNAPSEFYSLNVNDTVQIYNCSFLFDGTMSYIQQFRLKIIDRDNEYITEPFLLTREFKKYQ